MSETTQEYKIHRMFKRYDFNLSMFIFAIILAFVDAFLKSKTHFGFWDLAFEILLLLPLGFMLLTNEINNTYTKWLIPILLILSVDIFIYNNYFTQHTLPIVVFYLTLILYITSMHESKNLYHTLIPRLAVAISPIAYLIHFFSKIFTYNKDNTLYNRIGLALLITVPFMILFVTLFMFADENFNAFVKNIFDFNLSFSMFDIFYFVFGVFFFLILFIYGFSNVTQKESLQTGKSYDLLIIGIFLGMLNFIFAIFLIFQINYLFGGEAYLIEKGVNVADYARDGFFQLMWVMGIVTIIYLVVMSRYHGENLIGWLLSTLLFSTIVIGLSSLKKMYLYQSLKGATTLRYYVEWFDYLLLIILATGIFFIIRRINFAKLIDIILVMGILSFTIVSSINVDSLVASHNIEKFKNQPNLLDRNALSSLSVDALEALNQTDINITLYEEDIRDCTKLSEYHYGYCIDIKLYPKKIEFFKPFVSEGNSTDMNITEVNVTDENITEVNASNINVSDVDMNATQIETPKP
jgi:hypothetical protein